MKCPHQLLKILETNIGSCIIKNNIKICKCKSSLCDFDEAERTLRILKRTERTMRILKRTDTIYKECPYYKKYKQEKINEILK